MKKVLILYTSIGLGHKSIAENIGSVLTSSGYEVKLKDILEVQENWFSNLGKSLHKFVLTKLPFIWSFLYDSKTFTKLTLPLRVKVASKNYEATKLLIDQFEPDLVITTQTAASAIISFLKSKGLYHGKFAITFSDFHLHEYWLYETCDFYLANIEEQKQDMVKLGIPENKIFVCGITLKPKLEINSRLVKEKFGIKEDDKVVLVGSGSLGYGVDKNLVTELISKKNVKAIVLCGKNVEAYEVLSKQFLNTNASILKYHSNMSELYAVTDLYITKPGGLSVAESLQWGLPILVSHMLPGQELHNYKYLQSQGLVMEAPINLVSDALEELETASFKNSLLNNQKVAKIVNSNKVLLDAVESI